MNGLGRGVLLSIVLGIDTAGLSRSQQPYDSNLAEFEELRPGLFRHTLDLSPVPGLLSVRQVIRRLVYKRAACCLDQHSPWLLQLPTAVWLVQGADKHSWTLIDTGIGHSYKKSLKAALKTRLSSSEDKPKLILLTHSHADHTEVNATMAFLLILLPVLMTSLSVIDCINLQDKTLEA